MEKIIGDWSTVIKLTDKEAKGICRLGQGESCCAFLVMGETFECIRMCYPANSSILERLKNGGMNAKYKGGEKGCAWSVEFSEEQKPETGVIEESKEDLMLRIVELEKANRMYRERDKKNLHMEGLVRQMIREKKSGQISIRTLGKIDNLLGVEG